MIAAATLAERADAAASALAIVLGFGVLLACGYALDWYLTRRRDRRRSKAELRAAMVRIGGRR